MVKYIITLAVVVKLTIDYLAVCGSVSSTSSEWWDPPACIIAYFGTAVAVMLAVAADRAGTTHNDLQIINTRDIAQTTWNHEFMVAMPAGDPLWCNEFNLSSTVPHDTWVTVQYLNTGLSTLMRHNGSNVELDLEVEDTAASYGGNITALSATSSVSKRSSLQTLKRIWVIAKKTEKITFDHATNYRSVWAKDDAKHMYQLGRYCEHMFECKSGECSEIVSSGWTLNSKKQQFARQSVSQCESGDYEEAWTSGEM